MMTLQHLCRALAAAAFLLLSLPAPASDAAESAPALEAGVAQAQALFNDGRFDEALAVLRPLATAYPKDRNVLFQIGLAALEAAKRRPAEAEAEREALLDEAIAALHTMLVDDPSLVRVRLELARAFFHKREDTLARDHFERVLAGDPPAAVVANVQRFLSQMRARRRWTAYLGATIAPDTNIGSGSDEEIIYILGLPFRRNNADELTTSGVGVSVWTGGGYQHPLGDRLRLRTGVDVARKEYSGGDFDETYLAAHAGPRWLVDRRSEVSLLAEARRRWAGGGIDHDFAGARLEARRQLTPRFAANSRVSWGRRSYRDRDHLDGPIADVTLSGSWVVRPTMRADGAFGYSRERPESERQRNDSRRVRAGLTVALPLGFTVGGSAQFRWTDFEGDWSFFTASTTPREDRTRTFTLSVFKRDFTLYGFSPQVVMTRELRTSNAQLHDYQRSRGELRFVRQF